MKNLLKLCAFTLLITVSATLTADNKVVKLSTVNFSAYTPADPPPPPTFNQNLVA